MTPFAGFDLKDVQAALSEERLDGWLFYYFQRNDPIAEKLLGIDPAGLFTRRWFYFIPRRGEPRKLTHRIEPAALDFLPGERQSYLSWRELRRGLAGVLRGCGRVAMQYSPRNAVPYVSRVDAGTVELVRSLGVRVASSGDLIQMFEAVLTQDQWRQHERTAVILRRIVFEAFGFIREKLRQGRALGEYDVQRKILAGYRRRGLVSNSYPIVAVNHNSSQPHYVPSSRRSRPIAKGDWVLLDIWAKPRGKDAVYADITWCGFAGRRVPPRFERVFQIVREARDRALGLVQRSFAAGKPLRGWEADRAARGYIERKGYGKFFIHRTGHSIGLEDHGNGANLDGLETRETRRLLPRTLFSIEPGIYLKDFGARSEINVFVDGRQALVSGQPVQRRVVPILA